MVHFRFQSPEDLRIGYAWFSAMHTRMDIVLVGPGEAMQREITQQVYERVMMLDGLLNRFSAGSEVAKVNAKAVLEDVPISNDLYYLLEYAQQAYEQTNGLFDITIQSHNQSGSRPENETGYQYKNQHSTDTGPASVPTEAQPCCPPNQYPLSDNTLPLNPRAIHLQRNPLRVRFLHPGLQIDLGGLAKGYAVDQIREMLKEAQVEHYLISFGNSSIAAKGDRPGKNQTVDALNSVRELSEFQSPESKNAGLSSRVGWKVSLQNGSATYQLIDECLTVSGNETQPGGHIIDPRTGKLVQATTVAVKTNTAIEGEILSTTRFIFPTPNN